jgi:competence protein ComGC
MIKAILILRSKKAFTLIELLIVFTILAALLSVVIPFYYNTVEMTRKKICIAQQKTLFEAAALYELGEMAFLKNIGGQKARLDELVDKGYIKSNRGFECPSSPVQDYDDYQMIFEGNSLVDIECTLRWDEHKWP